jgi:hypothetical protein
MKSFHCHCGNRVFFDNTLCQRCERQLGFDPQCLDMIALDACVSGRLATPAGRTYRRCGNFHRYYNCNWLMPQEEEGELCFSCRMNQVIPALDRPGNLKLWTRMEEAKRRLLYSLLSLQLPITGVQALKFKFLEDHRRNPDVFEQFVTTGHLDSTITINIAEADDAARHEAREQMHERYRTVLGHLRHESGHFYFNPLTAEPARLTECRALFGDERDDYQTALGRYYAEGPPTGWNERFISAYASSHPAEDFAETFAHFLLITDALESARSGGLAVETEGGNGNDWIDCWISLVITLNEVGRSLGSGDAYPFLLSAVVKQKLEFIDRLVRRQAGQRDG